MRFLYFFLTWFGLATPSTLARPREGPIRSNTLCLGTTKLFWHSFSDLWLKTFYLFGRHNKRRTGRTTFLENGSTEDEERRGEARPWAQTKKTGCLVSVSVIGSKHTYFFIPFHPSLHTTTTITNGRQAIPGSGIDLEKGLSRSSK
jgi:hypothetical protein